MFYGVCILVSAWADTTELEIFIVYDSKGTLVVAGNFGANSYLFCKYH